MKKFKIPLVIVIAIILSFTFNSIVVFASKWQDKGEVGAVSNVMAESASVAGQGAAGIYFSAETTSGIESIPEETASSKKEYQYEKGKDGKLKPNSSKRGATNEPCYVWIDAGSLPENSHVLKNIMEDGLGNNFLKSRLIVDWNISPTTQDNIYRYLSGDMSDEEMLGFEGSRVILITPNAKAATDFVGYGDTGRCGTPYNTPLTNSPFNTATLYITPVPVVGADNAGGSSQNEMLAARAAASGRVTVEVEEVVKGKQYVANVNVSALDINDIGMPPYAIKDITYLWTVRGPSDSDPIVKTDKLSNISGMNNFSYPSTINYPLTIKTSGNTNGFSTSELKSALGSVYRNQNPQSSLSGSTYQKKATESIFKEATIKELGALLSTEPNVVSDLKRNASNHFQLYKKPVKKSGSSTTPLYVNGSLNGSYGSILTDTLTLNTPQDGKVVVGVSVIINGVYRVSTGFGSNDYVEFTYPLGYVSDAATYTTSNCSALQSDFGKLRDLKVDDTNAIQDQGELEGTSCKDEEWRAGAAIAKVDAAPGGKARLDGSASYPPRMRTHYYSYTADTKFVACDPMPDDDPTCREEVFTGSVKNVTKTTTPWKTFNITGYYWLPKYRIDMVGKDSGKKEIDMDTYYSGSSVMYGDLNNSNTYACLYITTDAGIAYGATSSKHISGLVNIDTYKKTDLTYGAEGKTPLKYADSSKFPYCDTIISEEKDRRIIENWAN